METNEVNSLKPHNIEVRGIKMKRKPMFDETGTTLLNGIKLSFEKGFGYNQNPNIKNNAHCIDDNRIIYILSSQIVLYDMLAETQKVIDSFDWDEEVGAMLYFKNVMLEDNILYALHNNNKSFPSLVLLNFSKNSTQKIMLANLQKQEKVTDIALLNDLRNIVTISKFDKVTRLTLIEVSSKQIKASEYLSFNPLNMYTLIHYPSRLVLQTQTEIIFVDVDTTIKTTLVGVRKWMEFENQNIVQISNSLHNEFCVYIITDQGNLYFMSIDLKEIKITKCEKYFLGNYLTLDANGNEVTQRKRPSAMCVNEYNISIGYEHIEELTLVKICAVSSQQPSFQTIRFSCPFLHKIVRMNFAVETMSICIVVQVKENDKYDFSVPIESQFLKQKVDGKIIRQNLANHALPAGKIFPVVFNLLLYDTLVETLRSPVQSVLNSMLLTKKILQICALPTKKLIIVLSADKKIKAIKYEHVSSISFDKMLAWQLSFNFNDQPSSLDVHPLTFITAVGFKQGVKLFNIFSDAMRTTNIQFPLKNCECVKYSRFGHLLIAGSWNQIMLIDPYENKIKNNVQLGHGNITKELSFIDRDMFIFGSFGNGSSQVMNLDGSKIFEVWNKNSKMLYSCYDPVFDIMIVSYEENEVKFYRERGQIEFAIMWTYPFVVTRILIVNELGTCFMGTSTGKIRAYQWPFTDMIKFNKSFTQIQLHRSPITQMKITHDFSYLITGAEDGTIFISKITAFSDGMVVSDASILHTFKVNKKNYTSLYYMQNFMCTNNSIEAEKEEQILQYESDKVDSGSEYTYVLQNLQMQLENAFRIEQENHKKQLKDHIDPLENKVEERNRQKVQLKEELNSFTNNWDKEIEDREEDKLKKMRLLYEESDHLKLKLDFYTKLYGDEANEKKQTYAKQLNGFRSEMESQEKSLENDCKELEKQFTDSLTNYQQLMKEEDQEGIIYKTKMMEQLEDELKQARLRGEQLRKIYNKSSHEIKTEEDKAKYFQQISSEMKVDIEISSSKNENLQKQLEDLGQMLKEKDQQIFDEEKAVKELLKKSINNYSHEEYLKHKQDELIAKAKYLEKEIENLDEKYRLFQDNFVEASKDTNDYITKIEDSYCKIEELKEKQKSLKQRSYLRKYKEQQIYSKILQTFHQCNSKPVFADKVKKILQLDDTFSNVEKSEKKQVFTEKRDHLIEQVINTNKLRKIDDTIKKTIIIKLNRETVNLTGQINELRKQKKHFSAKIKDIQSAIRQVQSQMQEKENREMDSLTDIVPANISVIRSQNSKHVKPLPFQVYQQNKLTQRNSTHSKYNSKSIMDEGSTHLPSIIKNSQSYSGSFLQQSSLFGVQENEDEIAQQIQ